MAPGLIPRGAVTAIAGVVIVVWGIAQVANVLIPDYEPPPEIHLAVMLVLGALFGLRKDDDRKDDDRKDEPPAPPAPAPAPVEPAPAPEELPPGRVSAADLIARLQQERRRDSG